MATGRDTGELREAIEDLRGSVVVVAVLSAVLNVLLLGSAIYIMLVFDSVLPSRSIPTLMGLLAIVLVVHLFQGVFETFRSRLIASIALSFDRRISARVQNAAFTARLRGAGHSSIPSGATRDLDEIRTCLSSPAAAAMTDAPWILLFLLVLAFLHVWLAVTALVGTLIMVGLAFMTRRASVEPIKSGAHAAAMRQAVSEERFRHAETIHVLGMEPRLRDRWQASNRVVLRAQEEISTAANVHAGVSRVFRIALQSLLLTVGALLVMNDKASGGVVFAGAVLFVHALAPIDRIIAHWPQFAAARGSWSRLESLLSQIPPQPEISTLLPQPVATLTIDGLVVVPPGSQRITAQGASFVLEAGDVLGIVGLSGSGKSSMARAMVGAWRPARGSVRLDGAAFDQYDAEQLGEFIGYVPQTFELVDGTVGENIARFDPRHDSDAIVAAATKAGVHDLIVSLPQGYETEVGPGGERISAGQRQRIALARALYKDPFLVVLDEPNSNLDAPGEAALDAAIESIRDRQGIGVIVAHRGVAMKRVNKVLYMVDGAAKMFGPRDAVLAEIAGARPEPIEGKGNVAA